MSKLFFPVPSPATQQAAQVDRARFQAEYNRFWANYCNLAAQPDPSWFAGAVEPLINIALGIKQPLFPELWLTS